LPRGDFILKHHDALAGDFPYVKEVIETLHQQGIKMGIVTTKMRKTTMMGLERMGIASYMDAIVTIDDVDHPKPHPEPVLKAVSMIGADPKTTLMVGDSSADIEAANAAGVTSVGVAWSLKGEAVLKQYHPKHIIYDMRDLLQFTQGKEGS
jgi:pyrophosphatase PpaX